MNHNVLLVAISQVYGNGQQFRLGFLLFRERPSVEGRLGVYLVFGGTNEVSFRNPAIDHGRILIFVVQFLVLVIVSGEYLVLTQIHKVRGLRIFPQILVMVNGPLILMHSRSLGVFMSRKPIEGIILTILNYRRYVKALALPLTEFWWGSNPIEARSSSWLSSFLSYGKR